MRLRHLRYLPLATPINAFSSFQAAISSAIVFRSTGAAVGRHLLYWSGKEQVQLTTFFCFYKLPKLECYKGIINKND